VDDSLVGFITRDVLKLNLEARDKPGAITELLDVLIAAGKVDAENRDALRDAIMKREELGSTGIGAGLAIPHVKASPLVTELVGAFGRSEAGIEFGASDGEACHVFFLMVSPTDGVSAHLQVLRKIASLGRSDHFLRFLQEASSEDEVLAIFEEVDEA